MTESNKKDETVVERLPPDEAFELLAHETRLRVLEVLNDAGEPLAFTDLRERVGMRDPGQFRYHLKKLAGRFVREESAEYSLTTAGTRVVGAVLSGGLTKTLDANPIPLDVSCSRCHAPLSVRFEADRMSVKCAECNFTDLDLDVPAGVIEGCPRETIPEIADRWLKRFRASLDHGLCVNCDGRLTERILVAGDDETPDWVEKHGYGAAVAYDCDRCGGNWLTSIAGRIMFHPASIAFHYEHGTNLHKIRSWKLDWPVTTTPTITSEDPLRIEVPITLDDETRVFVVNEDLDVVAECRE